MKSVMKAEMQAGEDIAIKERDDGSALAAMDDHVDPFEGTEDNTSASDDDGDGDTESFAEGGEVFQAGQVVPCVLQRHGQ